MNRIPGGGRAVKVVALTMMAGIAGVTVYAQLKGPSSSQTAYTVPTVAGVKTTALLSVGDSIGGYRMVGLPDGLGAFDNNDGTLTLLANHEIVSTDGVVRAHGAVGAFVSKWVIEKSTMRVISGGDLIQQVFRWNTGTQTSETISSLYAFNRFCSGDLPDVTAFYNSVTGKGTRERIYINGEESGAGHLQATVATGPNAGKSYELGKFNLTTNGSGLTGVGAWENGLASPYPQDKTVVIGNSDGGTGIQNNAVAVYVGTKTSSGTEADKAGLTNGTLKFINVAGNPVEIVNSTLRTTNITSGTRFSLSGTSSTTFSRPEDGQWNPNNPAEYYFVTTDGLDQVTDGIGALNGRTRLWRLTFDNVTNPDLGGKIDLLIDGRIVNGARVNMFDNITVNRKTGQIVLLEDVGGAPHNGKSWLYDPATDELKMILKHDESRFGTIVGGVAVPATLPFTNDEESSGIIDMSHILGLGYYLTSDQAHFKINAATPNGFTNPNELVEGGQLQLVYIPFPTADNKDQCKDNGWQGRFRKDGTVFKNQGDCVSYTNNGK